MKKDKKNTKQKLFEMMHKVGGMPLNENLGDYYGKYDYSSDDNADDDFQYGNTDPNLTLNGYYNATSFIGEKMRYGSHEVYSMTFIPREIKKINDNEFEFIGDMPEATIGTKGHFFIIGVEELNELQENGEVYWWDNKNNAQQYLSF